MEKKIIILKGLSIKQITHFFLEGENLTLKLRINEIKQLLKI